MTDLTSATILVTGASGTLGRQVIRELLDRGVRPIAMVRQSSDTTWLAERGLEIRRADLRNHDALREGMAGVGLVIHTAAWVSFRGDRRTQFTGINTFGAVGMYRAAAANGVRRFVHVSTVAAIGARPREGSSDDAPVPLEQLLTEEHAYNLDHLSVPYILTKRAAEHELRRLTGPDAPELVIVNPSIILSDQPPGSRRRQLAGWLERPLVPEFRSRINLVDIRDCAAGIVAALERGQRGQRYILGGDNISLRELVLQLSARGGWTPHLVRLPRPVVVTAARLAAIWTRVRGKSQLRLYPDLVRLADYDWVYSSRKAVEELGYQPRALAESIRDLFDGQLAAGV